MSIKNKKLSAIIFFLPIQKLKHTLNTSVKSSLTIDNASLHNYSFVKYRVILNYHATLSTNFLSFAGDRNFTLI